MVLWLVKSSESITWPVTFQTQRHRNRHIPSSYTIDYTAGSISPVYLTTRSKKKKRYESGGLQQRQVVCNDGQRVHPEFSFFFPARQVLRTRREKKRGRESISCQVTYSFFCGERWLFVPPKKTRFFFPFPSILSFWSFQLKKKKEFPSLFDKNASDSLSVFIIIIPLVFFFFPFFCSSRWHSLLALLVSLQI